MPAKGNADVVIFFAWLILAVVVAVAASMRGRVGFGWFLLTLAISPLITGLLVFVLPRRATGATSGTTSLIKGFGIAVLVGCLVVVAVFVIAAFAIVQHGGA